MTATSTLRRWRRARMTQRVLDAGARELERAANGEDSERASRKAEGWYAIAAWRMRGGGGSR